MAVKLGRHWLYSGSECDYLPAHREPEVITYSGIL
jgi:hypothetical protein